MLSSYFYRLNKIDFYENDLLIAIYEYMTRAVVDSTTFFTFLEA